MKFAIQLCTMPRLSTAPLHCDDMADALSEIFSDDRDSFYLQWNHVPIQVSYKYDLFVIFPEVLKLTEALSSQVNGSLRIRWGSNTFDGIWHIQWSDRDVRVNAQWLSVIGDLQDHLNSRAELEVAFGDFLAAFASLLNRAIASVENSGASLSDSSDLDRVRRLLQRLSP